MKAMLLAAGMGTRLRPLTDTRPKALVEIDGEPLLAIALRRLAQAGVREVVINLHHFGEQIEAWVAEHGAFGIRVAFSRETELLDTGGGLKQAAWFFDDGKPFLVHNVDVLSDIDLAEMVRSHEASGALATLAAMPRPTARPLLFDEAGRLCGRVHASGERLVVPVDAPLTRLGFCGIHVLSPEVFEHLHEVGRFSIVDAYLRLAVAGQRIRAFRVDGARWRDAGRPADLRPL
ncbi:nucleotidyltransferase family protein [Opitutales bacterium ASA1]|uniref:nucleotidyltransferase family protein n=1 Tax=Congregicoccus parvus TaxID=3081749 RepID=UPI002B319DB0|nr:nucleotidyltransferase family protein [Opitutales bacterium ASA1]